MEERGIKRWYRRKIDKICSCIPGKSFPLVHAQASDEPGKAQDSDCTHRGGKLESLAVNSGSGSVRMADWACPFGSVNIGLASVKAKLKGRVGTKVAGINAVGDLVVRILDDELVLLGKEWLLRVVGLLLGVPNVLNRRGKAHVPGQGPGAVSGGAGSKNVNGGGISKQRRVVPAEGDVVADSIKSSSQSGSGRNNHVGRTQRGIRGEFSMSGG